MSLSLKDALNPYLLFAFFAILVLVDSGTDLIEESMAEESLGQMIDDIFLFCLSVVIVVKIGRDLFLQRRSLQELQKQLESAKGKLAKEDQQGSKLADQYRGVVQNQFDRWKLTPSEQDVSLGLLKGLSFREIATVRSTNERTVRQQAASVYKKAGLTGRHELAAWFFEDMLAFNEGS